jgi:multisubunit Na+/H+ antiporter MnhG subunit
MIMFSEDDSTRFVTLGLIGTLLGVVVRFLTHSNIAVLVGAVGGLLVAFLLAAVRGEQF